MIPSHVSLTISYRTPTLSASSSGLSSFIIEPTSLLDLPNLVILRIFDYIDKKDSSHLSAAKSCKRLHLLILPALLSRHNIVNPEEDIILDNDNIAALPALLLSLHGTSTRLLSCSFHRNSFSDESYVFKGVKQLVMKMSDVKEVVLDFTVLLQDKREEKDISAESARDISGIITAAMAKSCKEMKVLQDNAIQPDWSFDVHRSPAPDLRPMRSLSIVPSSVERPANRFRNHVRSFLARSHSMPLPYDEVLVETSTNLSIFHVHSAMLISPPFCQWTIDTINNSSITDLSLANLDLALDPRDNAYHMTWNVFLESIHLPSLEHLCINSSNIQFGELSHFISRHPCIKSISLRCLTGGAPALLNPSRSTLPLTKLEKLSTGPGCITYFLDHSDALVNLTYISILYPNVKFSLGDFRLIDQAIASIARHFHSSRTRSLTLSIQFPGKLGTIATNAWLHSGGTSCRSLEKVTILVLDMKTPYSFTPATLSLLPAWIASFPSLKHVEFSMGSLAVSEDSITFIESLGTVCPDIETVTIQTRVHSLGSGLGLRNTR